MSVRLRVGCGAETLHRTARGGTPRKPQPTRSVRMSQDLRAEWSGGSDISRRGFLTVGAAGLAGASLCGVRRRSRSRRRGGRAIRYCHARRSRRRRMGPCTRPLHPATGYRLHEQREPGDASGVRRGGCGCRLRGPVARAAARKARPGRGRRRAGGAGARRLARSEPGRGGPDPQRQRSTAYGRRGRPPGSRATRSWSPARSTPPAGVPGTTGPRATACRSTPSSSPAPSRAKRRWWG